MPINYSDPQLQRMKLKAMAVSPYGGIQSRLPGLDKYLQEQESRRLSLADAFLRTKMGKERIAQMQFETGLSGKRLGLEQGYLDIAKEQMNIANRAMGVKEAEFGIRSQLQDLQHNQMKWRRDLWSDDIKQKEKELDMSTWLGAGTAVWSAYEGRQRANKEKLLADYYRKLSEGIK